MLLPADDLTIWAYLDVLIDQLGTPSQGQVEPQSAEL